MKNSKPRSASFRGQGHPDPLARAFVDAVLAGKPDRAPEGEYRDLAEALLGRMGASNRLSDPARSFLKSVGDILESKKESEVEGLGNLERMAAAIRRKDPTIAEGDERNIVRALLKREAGTALASPAREFVRALLERRPDRVSDRTVRELVDAVNGQAPNALPRGPAREFVQAIIGAGYPPEVENKGPGLALGLVAAAIAGPDRDESDPPPNALIRAREPDREEVAPYVARYKPETAVLVAQAPTVEDIPTASVTPSSSSRSPASRWLIVGVLGLVVCGVFIYIGYGLLVIARDKEQLARRESQGAPPASQAASEPPRPDLILDTRAKTAPIERAAGSPVVEPVASPAAEKNSELIAPTPRDASRESAGDAAWSAGDWPKAFEEFLPQASGGDPNAQVRIGRVFYEGLGRVPDFRIAESWFRKAAKQGSAEAKYRLGLLYSEDRKGAPFDLDVAVAFFSEAAEGSPEAAFRLGRLYWDGVGVPEDRAKARELIKASATAGYSAAVDWIRENDK